MFGRVCGCIAKAAIGNLDQMQALHGYVCCGSRREGQREDFQHNSSEAVWEEAQIGGKEAPFVMLEM